MKYALLTVFLFIVAMPQSSFAQQYFVKSYTAEDGLPTRMVTDACQDKEGYMWFTTFSGISKYDGFSFTNFDTASGLPKQQYRKIVCDEKGVLWAVPYFTQGELVFFENNVWKSIKLPNLTTVTAYNTSFDVSYSNQNPVICVGSYVGIDVYRDSKWAHFDISGNKDLNRIYGVTENNGSFYLATNLGLCVFDGATLNWSLNSKLNPGSEAFYAVKFENPNTPAERMWVLTNHSIGYYQNNVFTELNDEFLLDDVDVANFPYLGIGKSDEVFFGNNFSKFILKISERKITPLRHSRQVNDLTISLTNTYN